MKKIFSLALLSALVLSVASCGGSNDDTGWVDPSDYGDGEAYKEIDDENVTSITVFKNDWADFNNAKKNNTPIYKKLSTQIGCDIEAQNSSSDWETQLALLQADEDLPDIFITNGPDNSYFFDKLIRNGDILSISDWVSPEHYPNIYNYIQQFKFLRTNVTYANDEMYFIPSSWHLEKSLYIRTDWIDNLNAKLDEILVKEGVVNSASEITDAIREEWKFGYPEDLLEFYRLARAFTLYDPDNNGQDDTYGYISESNKDFDAWIYNAFDAGWNQFIEEENGTYTFSDITDNSMYATQFMTRLIAEGYCSIDSLTGDIDGKQNKFMNGKAGMMYAHNWYNVIVSGMMSASNIDLETARSKVAMIEPPAGKNGTHGGDGQKGFWQGFCINANMSNARIRKCLEFYDYLLSDEGYELLQYGVEGTHYTKSADGTKTSLLPVDKNGFRDTINTVDPASLLYALVDWTMAYNNTLATNADIIAPRQAVSERNSNFTDYPCVSGDAYAEYKESCHNLFLTQIVTIEKNEGNRYYKSEGTYNPKTFGWDDLYSVSNVLKSTWKAFVKNYTNDTYGGQKFIDEYNEILSKGKVTKVSKDDYVFKSKLS